MSEAQQNAAQLVAAGKLTIPQIAKKAGVSQRTISAWKTDKEFQAAVKHLRNAWRAEVRVEGPADPDYRLRVLRDLEHRLQSAVRLRAKDPQMKKVPGGRTGLVVVTYKMQSLGEGRGSAKVPEYSIDTETPAAIAALLEQAAIEKGQWNVKTVNKTSVSITEMALAGLRAGRLRAVEAQEKLEAAARPTPDR